MTRAEKAVPGSLGAWGPCRYVPPRHVQIDPIADLYREMFTVNSDKLFQCIQLFHKPFLHFLRFFYGAENCPQCGDST